MDIVRAVNLGCGYGGTRVLSGLTFAIPRGRITTVAGVSGSGKTTLLKTLTGLMPPLEGEMFFAGEKVDFTCEASLDGLYRRIGVLYQGGALLNSLSLFENVALPVRMQHPHVPEEIIAEIVLNRLSQVGLADSSDKYPAELSGGMRKRGALARALVLDPDVVFCDEPSSGLDPITSLQLDELLLGLKEALGMTIVVVTHEVRSIERIADHILLIHEGGLRYSGGPADVLSSQDPFLRSFFLREEDRNDA